MPGVSLSSDTGEGRFVNIRGIDANLDGATYGGVPLLNTNPGGTAAGGGGRAVEFDTIPTGAIDGVVVTMTGLPDHEAEGLGGSVELSPRTAANIEKPFLDATLGWGYEPLHDHTGPVDIELAAGARFGFGDHGLIVQQADSDFAPRVGFFSNPTPFSFVISGSTKDDRRAIDDLEESYVDSFAPGTDTRTSPSNAVSEYDLRRYDYHRFRFGYGTEFDFKPNEDHQFYVRADVAGYTEAVHKNFLLFTDMAPPTAGQSVPGDANAYLTTMTPEVTLTDERETHRNQVYVIGGRDDFGRLQLDYRAAYSVATYDVDHNIGAKFQGPSGVALTYDNVTTPNYPIFTLPGGFNLDDASQYALSSLQNSQDYDIDDEYSYAVNATYDAHFINDDDRFKFGAEVRLRNKSASEYDEQNLTVPTVSLASISGPAMTYYDGHYTNGPFINAIGVQQLVLQAEQAAGPSVFNPGSYFTARENIYAGYGEYDGRIGQWGFLAGVRVEATSAVYGGYIQTTNPDGSSANVFEDRETNYVNAFPTVQVRYDFTPDMTLRATYSTGIARPGFNQNTTAASVDFTQAPVAVSRGNPDLRPTLGDNFDLSFEDYLANGGILQLALFEKEFTDYIVPRIENGVSDPLAPGQLATVTTYLNVPSAYARGFQAAYHQQFTFLPHPLQGLGIESNLTLVDSRIEEYTPAQSLSGKAEYGMLPGTSATTWNMAGFYEAYGVQARIAAEYVSHSLFGLGGDKLLDTIQDDRLTVDFTSSYRLNENWSAYFNVKNINNEPLRYYEGSPNRPIQREFYEQTFEAGVKAHF